MDEISDENECQSISKSIEPEPRNTMTPELNDHDNTNDTETHAEPSSTSYHAVDNSDTGSCNSESRLIPVPSNVTKESELEYPSFAEHITMDFENPTEVGLTSVNESSNMADTCSTDKDYTLLNIQETKEGQVFGSGVSVASILRDSEVITANPIHVFGSGWEFGSICSINLHGSGDVSRSRANTMDHHLSRYPTTPVQDRLLSRIFKDKIGSMQLDKGSEKEVYVSFIQEPVNAPIDAISHNRSTNMKNLLILSASITFLHIAVFGLRNLQSSLNSEDGLGVYSLATLCGAFMVGSLISPFIVQRYGPNNCLSLACFGLLIYVIANYFPNFYAIMPASVVHGLCNALLWNAVCTYITELGIDEAYMKGKVASNVLSRYFGIFFLMLQLSMVLGNLISSVILSQSANRISKYGNKYHLIDSSHISTTIAYTFDINATQLQISGFPLVRVPCGIAHCDIDQGSTTKPDVDDLDKLFLLGTYSSCAIIAVLVIQCCLEKLPNYIPNSSSFKEAVKQAGSVLTMVVDRRFCFIVMLCMHTVISNGFVVADVLKMFITCPLGVKMVGYSMICFGICGSISSYLFGKLVKFIGNIAAFLTAAVLNLTSLALMVTWEPTPDDQYLLFAFIGAWGFADGIWQSQINSLISAVFADRYETAFGCCRVLQGLAGIAVFTMSNSLCMMSKMIFTTTTCLLAIILYIVMELLGKKKHGTHLETEIYVK